MHRYYRQGTPLPLNLNSGLTNHTNPRSGTVWFRWHALDSVFLARHSSSVVVNPPIKLSIREKSSGFPQLEELANLYGED